MREPGSLARSASAKAFKRTRSGRNKGTKSLPR
jgi:hypothetical protein